MSHTPVESAFIELLRAIETESENLQALIREAIAQADLPTARTHQEKLKKLLAFRANLIKAHRKWRETSNPTPF
jgi:hypothetical protein